MCDNNNKNVKLFSKIRVIKVREAMRSPKNENNNEKETKLKVKQVDKEEE